MGRVAQYALQRLARELAERWRHALDDVWFCVEYELADPLGVRANFATTEARGLVFHHALEPVDGQEGTVPRLASYWTTERSFADSRKPYEREFGVGQPTFRGYVRDLHLRKQPLPRRLIGWSKYIAFWLAVAFAARNAVIGVYGWSTAKPNFEAALDLPQDVVEGDDSAATLRLYNYGDEETRFTVEAMDLFQKGQANSVLHLLSQPWSEELDKAEQRSIERSLRAPSSGRYEFRSKVRANCGLWGEQVVPLRRKLRIWPEGVVVQQSLVPHGVHQARLEGAVLVGRPQPTGLVCEAILSGEPKLRFGAVPLQFDRVGYWDEPTYAADGTAGRLQWSVNESLAGFQELNFSIAIETEESTNWGAEGRRLTQVTCAPRQEGA